MEQPRVPCVGAVVQDDRSRLLLVRRGTDPGRGLWSVPGGRIEAGEEEVDAVVREVAEETGLRVVPSGLVGVVERAGPGGVVYRISDFRARLAAGVDPASAQAGDDAAEVGWFTAEDMGRLTCVDGLVEQLRAWGVLPEGGAQPPAGPGQFLSG